MAIEKSILDLKKGEKGVIDYFKDPEIGKDLLTIGFLPESVIQYIRKAPFGGAVYVNIDGQNVALRNAEAKNIIIKSLGNG